MPIGELQTTVSVGPTRGNKIGNLTFMNARFFGRPNFSGELDRFKDDRRKFTILVPNDLADQLRGMGWNVKTLIPNEEEKAEGREEISIIKVMVDDISEVQIRLGDGGPNDLVQNLAVPNFGVVDRTRFDNIDLEIRAWEYNAEEHPGKYSARLVKFVGLTAPNPIAEKYGI